MQLLKCSFNHWNAGRIWNAASCAVFSGDLELPASSFTKLGDCYIGFCCRCSVLSVLVTLDFSTVCPMYLPLACCLIVHTSVQTQTGCLLAEPDVCCYAFNRNMDFVFCLMSVVANDKYSPKSILFKFLFLFNAKCFSCRIFYSILPVHASCFED